MGRLEPETSVRYLKGVGPKSAIRLEKLAIKTVNDLLYHFPSYYQDFRKVRRIGQLRPGEVASVRGEIRKFENRLTKTGKTLQRAILADATGQLELLWFNQPFRAQSLTSGQLVVASGMIKDGFQGKVQMVNPLYEIGRAGWHTQRLVPIYPETQSVTSHYLRNLIGRLLSHLPNELLPDYFSPAWRKKYHLLPRRQAISQIHFPDSMELLQQARRTLAFEELFLLQLPLVYRRRQRQNYRAPRMKIDRPAHRKALRQLPFQLTPSQKQSLEDIFADLQNPYPMNRLLEGDVGTGKTIVAALAGIQVIKNGYRVALMAPTEILAWQHYQNLSGLLEPLGIKIGLLTSQRQQNVEASFLVGTHALFHRRHLLANLGLAVIDEQHRFGVGQRSRLARAAAARRPHILTMTATPIPRTINLVWRGDLDISHLTDLLPGRQRVATFVVPAQKRPAAYRWLKKEIKRKKCQAFIICPFIETSETLQTVRAAKEEFRRLQKVFPELRLALLHGQLKPKEKEVIFQQMRRGKFDVLVATPVVEVGVDLPRAGIMIIENAERFGLAQLHQLRGRVGRNKEKAHCFLFTEAKEKSKRRRLELLTELHCGLKLAEADLKIRGPGKVFGAQQHGFPQLKVASWSDIELVTATHRLVTSLLEKDPRLETAPLLSRYLSRQEKQIAMN